MLGAAGEHFVVRAGLEPSIAGLGLGLHDISTLLVWGEVPIGTSIVPLFVGLGVPRR